MQVIFAEPLHGIGVAQNYYRVDSESAKDLLQATREQKYERFNLTELDKYRQFKGSTGKGAEAYLRAVDASVDVRYLFATDGFAFNKTFDSEIMDCQHITLKSNPYFETGDRLETSIPFWVCLVELLRYRSPGYFEQRAYNAVHMTKTFVQDVSVTVEDKFRTGQELWGVSL